MGNRTPVRRQWVTFVVGTYLCSWILFAIGGSLDLLPLILLGIWSPTIVALVLTGRYFKGGVRQMLKRFRFSGIAWYWYAALLLLPGIIHFTGRSIWEIAYTGDIQSGVSPLSWWPQAIIPSILIAGLGEELGWRGFLMPRLQQEFKPFKATVILALIHLLWHLPTYWLGQGMHNVPFLFILAFVFPWTFIFVWIVNRSGGSLVFAVLFHAISNASLSIVRFMPLDSEVPIVPGLLTQLSLPAELAGPYLTVCAVYAVAALLVYRFGKFDAVRTELP